VGTTAEDRLGLEFLRTHPEDAARVLERFDPAEAAAQLAAVPALVAATAVEHMVLSSAVAVIAALEPERAAALLAETSIDQSAALLRRVPPPVAERIIERAPRNVVTAALRMLVEFPEGTAGALIDPTILSLPVDLTCAEALERVRREPRHAIYYVYVVDRERRLAGVLNLRELMLAEGAQPLAAAMHTTVSRLRSDAAEDEILAHPGWREYHALPVVDADGHLLGAIRYETLRRLESGRTSASAPNPLLATAMSLGELYWFSLRTVLGEMADAAAARYGSR
jgi:magnesium transporter